MTNDDKPTDPAQNERKRRTDTGGSLEISDEDRANLRQGPKKREDGDGPKKVVRRG